MDLNEILNKPALATKAAKFMLGTKLLGQFGAVSSDITVFVALRGDGVVLTEAQSSSGNADAATDLVHLAVKTCRVRVASSPSRRSMATAT